MADLGYDVFFCEQLADVADPILPRKGQCK